jgi:hypothetical protein
VMKDMNLHLTSIPAKLQVGWFMNNLLIFLQDFQNLFCFHLTEAHRNESD